MSQEGAVYLDTSTETPRRALKEDRLGPSGTPMSRNNSSALRRRISTSGGRKSGVGTRDADAREENVTNSGKRMQENGCIMLNNSIENNSVYANLSSDEAVSSTPQIGTPGGTPYMLRSRTRQLNMADKKDVVIPPLDLSNDDSYTQDRFSQLGEKRTMTSNDRDKDNDEIEQALYSTPRKRTRGASNVREERSGDNGCDKGENIGGTDTGNREVYEECGDNSNFDNNSNSRKQRSSSRRSNIRSTPRTRTHEHANVGGTSANGSVDECIVKDRKSILKQYDPDNVNTTTMSNIKTPKSQKKVQFGVEDLIIIDENLQIGANNTKPELDRMSILSEFDDSGSRSVVYNFPSLDELIGNKDENGNRNDGNGVGTNKRERQIQAWNNIPITVSEGAESDLFAGIRVGADQAKENGTNDDSGMKTNRLNKDQLGGVECDSSENFDITDQINISGYSISCRDSITPNTPGAFLSVVMKNLSSVNFSDEKNQEAGKNSVEKEMENDDAAGDTREGDNKPHYTNETDAEDCNTKITHFEENLKQDSHETTQIEVNLVSSNEHMESEGLVENINLAKSNSNSESESESYTKKETSTTEDNETGKNNSTVVTEINEECLVNKEEPAEPINDRNMQEVNTKLNELLTPKITHIRSDTRKKALSPKSESLLNSLYNTKSILNIVPKGYTWEEFLSLLNLNYNMDSFNVFEFGDHPDFVSATNGLPGQEAVHDVTPLVFGINENRKLIEELSNLKREDAEYLEVTNRYVIQLTKSIRNQVWEETEGNKLMKIYTDDIFENNYKNNLLRFPDSELATVLAIIVNKSRYGCKQDEKIKSELLDRLSKYFSVENRHDYNNMFYLKSWLYWNEEIILPYKNSLLKKYDDCIKRFFNVNEQIINNKNRIQNAYVLLSTLESCQISEMHVNKTYWNAMKLIHDNINYYKEEINRMNNYIALMTNNRENLVKLLIKEEELSNSLVSELNDWKYKKDHLKYNLNSLRIKEEFAGFTWDLFTMNKFQTIINLNNNTQYPARIRVCVEWNIDGEAASIHGEKINGDLQARSQSSPPVMLGIELINDNFDSGKDAKLFMINNYQLQDKIYQAYINIIEKTLNLRLTELYLEYKKLKSMNNNVLIELIRGIFQSCIVLLWRSESIIFEILNITKVFNLAIIDIDENCINTLIMNIPILIGIDQSDRIYRNNGNGKNSSPLLLNCNSNGAASSPITPNSLTSKLSPHLLISTRPIISIKFNITNSLFNSIGTLVNSIQDVSVYNVNEDTSHDMIRVFKEQINEVRLNKKNKCFSAVYLGYNCLLSIIQNTIQEGGKNQLIWKRPLEKFAPRLLNAVQIGKLHQNY